MIDPHFIFLLDAADEEEARHQMRITKRNLRDVSDPFSAPQHLFKGLYRLSKNVVFDLVEEISPFFNIQREEIAIPVLHRILTTLHFLAQGSYQKGVGQDMFIPMAQQTVSLCLNQVTTIIVERLAYNIKFPTTQEEQTAIKQRFFEKGGFPGIIGAIDGTHIGIQAPPFNDPVMPGIVFLNRRRYYSINTQIIVDADLRILGVLARFPGSVHDSAIWTSSAVKRFLEDQYINGNNDSWLIGDSGYPLQPFLMTPITGHNLNQGETIYNQMHKSTRNVIERLNGVLKTRFRSCFGHRILHYKPPVAAKIINTCCILHNICLRMGDNLEETIDDDVEPIVVAPNDNDEEAEGRDDGGRNWLNEGRLTRQRIINNYMPH